MNDRWGIVGLGWLGQELSNQLKEDGIPVWGTHRDTFDFLRDEFPRTPADILFLNTPPLRTLRPEDFAAKIHLEDSARIIFVSSTSVYGQTSGELNESNRPAPVTDSGRWLLQVEDLLRKRFGDRLLVIRPGGLIGGDRHPARSLSGKENVSNPSQKINLIHRADLIGIIRAAVSAGLPLINAVAPHHPRRDEYYSEWCARLNLPAPKFSTEEGPAGKIISSQELPKIYTDWKIPRLDSL